MTETYTLQSISPRYDDFRIPRFEVRVGPLPLTGPAVPDVLNVQYTDSTKEMGKFEIVVNNWDPDLGQYKYIGSETSASLRGDSPASRLYHLFEPAKNKYLELRLGYSDADLVKLMERGII